MSHLAYPAPNAVDGAFPQMAPLAYPIGDAERAAGVGKTTLFEAIRKGELPARKLGKKTLILATDLHAWLERLPRREVKAAAA